MAIFTNSKPSGDDNKKSGMTPEHHDSSNQNSKESNNNMSDMTNSIPFSIPVGMPGCWNHEKSSDAWSQNPFIYLLFLWMFGNGGFGNGWNRNGVGPANGIELASGAQGLANSESISDLRAKLAETYAAVQCGNKDLSGLECALNGLGMSVSDLKTVTLQGIASIDKEIATGNMNLIQQLMTCCCEQKTAMASGFCSVEKEILRQSNAIEAGFANTVNTISNAAANLGFQSERNTSAINSNVTQNFCNTNQILAKGFSDLGYLAEKNTSALLAEVVNQGNLNRAQALELHNVDIVAQKDAQIAKLTAKNEVLARDAQTAYLISQLKPVSTSTTA